MTNIKNHKIAYYKIIQSIGFFLLIRQTKNEAMIVERNKLTNLKMFALYSFYKHVFKYIYILLAFSDIL